MPILSGIMNATALSPQGQEEEGRRRPPSPNAASAAWSAVQSSARIQSLIGLMSLVLIYFAMVDGEGWTSVRGDSVRRQNRPQGDMYEAAGQRLPSLLRRIRIARLQRREEAESAPISRPSRRKSSRLSQKRSIGRAGRLRDEEQAANAVDESSADAGEAEVEDGVAASEERAPHSSASPSPQPSPAASVALDYSRTHTALIAGRWFGGSHPWATGHMQCASGCKIQFAHHGIDPEAADMILFHGGSTDWPENAHVLARPRRAHQLRALMAAETMNFRALTSQSEMDQLDTEVSFRTRSLWRDIQYPLETITRWDKPVAGVSMASTWEDVTTSLPVPVPQRRKAADRTITWASNHCNSVSGREDYARELNKHIGVEIYAAPCLQNAPQEHLALQKQAQWDLWRTYKYYLAFENTRIDDYFTEKLYLAFTRGQVPIVLGGSNVADHVPSKDSYIDVRDYPSPKALAEYLQQLEGDPAAYEAYFAWQKRPFSSYGPALRDAIAAALPTAKMNGGWKANPNFFACGLCEALAQWHAAGRPRPPRPDVQGTGPAVPAFEVERAITIAADGTAVM